MAQDARSYIKFCPRDGRPIARVSKIWSSRDHKGLHIYVEVNHGGGASCAVQVGVLSDATRGEEVQIPSVHSAKQP